MAYCTLDDVKEQIDEVRLIQLTDDEGFGTVNEGRVARAIADADEEINGYAGSRRTVPLDPVPAVIRKYSVDIAVYNLYGRRDRVPDSRAERYRNAVRFLEQVAMGKISLGENDPEGNPPASDAPWMSAENPVRTFGRKSLSGF